MLDRFDRYMDWLDSFPFPITMLLIMGTGLSLLLLVLSPFIAYDVLVSHPRWVAWETACHKAGGRPMPTSVWHDKNGTHYGDYICAKVDEIHVGVDNE